MREASQRNLLKDKPSRRKDDPQQADKGVGKTALGRGRRYGKNEQMKQPADSEWSGDAVLDRHLGF